MKFLHLFLSLFISIFTLLPISSFSQKLDNTTLSICNVPPGCQEQPICTFFDDCFQFDFYAPKDLGNGTSALKYKITNFSESTFKRATFELPGQGASTPAAISPTTSFRNRYNHSVINKFNDSLIAFNAINAGTFSYGGFEVYYYIVNNADLNAPYGRKVQVTASAGRPWQLQRTGSVIIDIDACIPPCPTPIAALFLFPPGDLCLNNPTPYTISATPQPGATFNWTITNGTIVSGNGTNTINIRPDSATGTLRVSLVVTNQCGFAAASKLFNVINCGLPCPTVVDETCYKEDCCFGYQLNGSQIGAGPGEFRPDFTLTGICGQQVTSISFSLPNLTPAQQAALNPFASTYSYTTTVTSTLLTFTATTGDFNAAGEFDDFVYTLPASAVTAPGGNLVTVTINTISGTFGSSFSQTFDLLNNDPSCGIAPLPVELTKFNGKATPEGIALTWTTATEKNNDRFEIERSPDGKHFERIGNIKGSGNSSTQLNYSYLDSKAAKGINYYRLKQVDFDGKHEYSRIISVRNGEGTNSLAVLLVPNPCLGEKCSVILQATDTRNPITIELQDLTGRIVYSKQVPADQTTLELPKLESGAGIYILTAKNGKYTAHQKVLFQ